MLIQRLLLLVLLSRSRRLINRMIDVIEWRALVISVLFSDFSECPALLSLYSAFLDYNSSCLGKSSGFLISLLNRFLSLSKMTIVPWVQFGWYASWRCKGKGSLLSGFHCHDPLLLILHLKGSPPLFCISTCRVDDIQMYYFTMQPKWWHIDLCIPKS